MLRLLGLAFLLSCLSSCMQPPELGGKELLCDDAKARCPVGLRCYQGLCVYNSPPRLLTPAAGESLEAHVGETLTLTASASDPENDTLTFTWRQLDGPGTPLLAADTLGESIDLVPLELGVHHFEVEVHDADPVDPDLGRRQLSVTVTPVEPTIYLSDGGEDDDDCGSFDAPCASAEVAVAAMRAQGFQQIAVAAGTTLQLYPSCLELDDGEAVLGCFDPETWAYAPGLRAQCAFVCGEPTGHRLSGHAALRDLTLGLEPDLKPDGSGKALTTLVIDGGDSTVTDVDIETAACGTGCVAVGVVTIEASPTLERVEVRGDTDSFDPIATFVGMYLVGGAPIVHGSPDVRSPEDGGRGGVVMSAPANDTAVGILAANSAATLSGLSLTGGFGPELTGMQLYGGTPTITGNDVSLVAYGTRSLIGIVATACSSDAAPCNCDSQVRDCSLVTPPSPVEIYVPSATVSQNHVDLSAGADSTGFRPCSGIALAIGASHAGNEVSDNHLVVHDDFTLGAGIFSGGSAAVPDGQTPNLVQDNVVEVGSSAVDAVCAFFNQQDGAELEAGAIGLGLFTDNGIVVSGNQLTIGTSEETSVGMYVIGGNGAAIAGNLFEVGNFSSGLRAKVSYGAVLLADLPTADNPTPQDASFDSNEVRLLADADNSIGLAVSQHLHWSIRNNLVYGGLGTFDVGMSLFTGTPDPDWPYIAHNTLSGGGDSPEALTSTAILMITYDENGGGDPNCGIFENNLLDGGNAQGRRYLLNDLAGGVPSQRLGNLGQFVGTTQGPDPVLIIPAGARSIDGADGGGGLAFHVLNRGSGEAVTLYALAKGGVPAIIEGESTVTNARPTAWWAGGRSGQEAIALVTDQGLVLGQNDDGYLSEFKHVKVVSHQDGVSETRHPAQAVGAQMVGSAATDIVFVERQDGGTPGSIWVMENDGSDMKDPVPLKTTVTLVDPSVLAVDPERRNDVSGGQQLLIGDGAKVHALPQSLTFDFSSYGYASGSVIDTGSFTHIDQLLPVQFAEPGAADPNHVLDLIIIGDGQLALFRNVDLDGGVMPRATRFNAVTPCDSGSGPFNVATAVVGDFNITPLGNEMAIGCSNGQIEFYRLSTGLPAAELFRTDDYVLGYQVRTLAFSVTDDTNVFFAAITGEDGDPQHRIEGWGRDISGPTNGPVLSHVFLPDIAYRAIDGTLASDFATPPLSGFSTTGLDACKLRMRTSVDPYDLLLDPTDTGCKDQGQTLSTPLTTDVQGQLRDATPDVGADELP